MLQNFLFPCKSNPETVVSTCGGINEQEIVYVYPDHLKCEHIWYKTAFMLLLKFNQGDCTVQSCAGWQL